VELTLHPRKNVEGLVTLLGVLGNGYRPDFVPFINKNDEES
jgi:hypothetical protein